MTETPRRPLASFLRRPDTAPTAADAALRNEATEGAAAEAPAVPPPDRALPVEDAAPQDPTPEPTVDSAAPAETEAARPGAGFPPSPAPESGEGRAG